MTPRTIIALILGAFAAAFLVNIVLLPGDHIISSLYLIPVLIACHSWTPRAVAATTAAAAAVYFVNAALENRPLIVWPFAVVAFAVVGYLTVRFAMHEREIACRAQRELDQRRRLQTFIGMVSHDLAGGLTNVLVGVEMLERLDKSSAAGRVEPERVAVTAIEGGARQMRRLLDDLRDAAAIGAGQFQVRPGPMDLVAAAREVVALLGAGTEHHRFCLSAPDRLEGTWDADRIGQLLTNLVSNAVKYSPAGGAVEVDIALDVDDVVIAVRDHGIGIDPRDQATVFEPFQRLRGGREASGSGLGLWIAKAIVDAHQGRIWVESDAGAGSSFFVSLPVTRECASGGQPAAPRRDPGRSEQPSAAPRPRAVGVNTAAA